MRKEKRKVEIEKNVWVAEDGKEFSNESECKSYEFNLKVERNREKAEKYRIHELDDILPLDNEGLIEENSQYRWFQVHSKEQFEVLNNAYGGEIPKPLYYPEMVCIEYTGYEWGEGDVWGYLLSNIKRKSDEFWGKMGYKMKLEK